MPSYKKVGPGEWQQPIRRGYRLMCCDCGLVHRLDFRVLRRNSRGARTVQFRAYRDERATAAARRGRTKGTKLYAVRDKKGRFKDVRTYRRRRKP